MTHLDAISFHSCLSQKDDDSGNEALPNCTLFVKNINWKSNEEDLKNVIVTL